LLAIQRQVATIEQNSYASAQRVAVACGPEEVLVRTSVGYVLCSPRDYAVLACLLDTGELERGTRLVIEKIVKPGDIFIDVGAHLGLHTLAAARAMHGKGRIIAFEPFEPTKRLLEKSVWINGFSDIVEIHQAAVFSHPGSQPLFLGVISGHHSLFPLQKPTAESAAPVSVPLVTLDAVMASHPTANVVKIDAEGAELDVVEGGRSVIQQNPNIALIVEFGPSHLRRTEHTTQNWFACFESLGMVYKAINPNTGALEDWSIDKLASIESVNLLLARPFADVWLRANAAR
jgi:FkbM family methyltransferase